MENSVLAEYSSCFEAARFSVAGAFVSDLGRERLKKEWPAVMEEVLGTVG